MDKVLNDLASWKQTRQSAQPSTEERQPEEDTGSMQLVENSLARERELLEIYNKFEE